MLIKNKQLIISLAAVIVVVVMALAAGMNAIDFQEGRNFWISGDRDNSINIALPTAAEGSESVAKFLGYMGAALVILLPVGIIIIFLDPEQRKKILSAFMQVMVFVMVAIILNYVINESDNANILPDFTELDSEGSSAASGDQLGKDLALIEPTGPAEAPDWVVALASSIAFLVMILVGKKIYDRFLKPSPLQQLAQDARGALKKLRSGEDLNDAIKKCYYEMSETLRKEQSIRRNQAMTVREFEELLEQSGIPRNNIHDLTRLFEKVRYGAKEPTKEDEDLAVECLTAIVKAASMGGAV